VLYHHLINELTFNEIYDLKIKNKIPFLMSKRDKLLLRGLETITDLKKQFLKKQFNSAKSNKLYSLILETLAYYETTNKSVNELESFLKLKVFPLKSISNQYIRLEYGHKYIEAYTAILDDAILDIEKTNQMLLSHDEKIASIDLKVLKSYYN